MENLINDSFKTARSEQKFVMHAQFCGKHRCKNKAGCYMYKNMATDQKVVNLSIKIQISEMFLSLKYLISKIETSNIII